MVLVGAGTAVPIPYVALGPGPTFNTLSSVDGTQVISFTGAVPASVKAKVGSGHLNMTTVSVSSNLGLFTALGLWMSGRYALVPRAEVYPPNKTVQQVNQQNTQAFQDSQSSAEIAALRYLKKYPTVAYVGTINAGSPSSSRLQPQDQITAIDGKTVGDAASVRATLKTTLPGQVVSVSVLRAGKTVVVKVRLMAEPSVGKQGFLGITPVERPKAPFSISISLANIGGPSAGLMFTLGILDKLTPGGLTGGRYIAGTGTMEVTDDKGTVGPIGGILLKMIAARSAGATVFLVPADNCPEALTRVPAALELARVSTLGDAVAALKTLSSGGTPSSC